ncbi:SOS response-associated peptidase [Caulobacter sp. 17J65-9]|uniref:SOS response-associated peptidase n=1 Tax=Caulobacter sp. 17J65-9 TaxID=2709382 RepID=UPI0013C5B2B5|nr:SOS response-associated peptidase [Caulobacter sp. 17J65-9]NEX91167.1 SOS response-associated peptidase [Caulobacter sp. 17J65-9]
MCGRFSRDIPWSTLHDALNIIRPAPQNLEPAPDIRPTTQQWVARREGEGFALDQMRWGLVPFWHGGKPLKNSGPGAKDGFNLTTFNARAEEAAKKPVFRGAFARRRCLVPASGWYEWTGDKGAKTKWHFGRIDGQFLMFAGIWDECTTSDAGVVTSFTLLTHDSTGHLTTYHDRAPIVLEPGEWSTWLDPEADPMGLLAPGRAERFEVRQAA